MKNKNYIKKYRKEFWWYNESEPIDRYTRLKITRQIKRNSKNVFKKNIEIFLDR